MTKVVIRTGDVAGFFSRAKDAARRADRGDAFEGKVTLSFEDPQKMFAVLSEERRRLMLEVMQEPKTINWYNRQRLLAELGGGVRGGSGRGGGGTRGGRLSGGSRGGICGGRMMSGDSRFGGNGGMSKGTPGECARNASLCMFRSLIFSSNCLVPRWRVRANPCGYLEERR